MYRTTLLLASFVFFSAFAVAQPSQDEGYEREVERIRAVTEAYHDIEVAEDAGYPSTEYCMESTAGGMGHHFMNEDLLDRRLEVEKPEILVYAPTGDGGLELAGVEYVVPYSVWGPDEAPPRIFDQDLKRADGLEIWYLHVWVWKENASGLFADWNPVISCSR